MRHQKKGKTLGRTKAPREAMLRNLVTSLFVYEKIQTTTAKAKYLRPFAEKMITLGKVDTLANRRTALKFLYTEGSVKKLFEVVGPKFKTRKGGYTRITKINPRAGDNAEMAIIELVD
ncbi:MAG: 50S ribosomal protein L17 [Candidatus Buchananbacteria bacterium]